MAVGKAKSLSEWSSYEVHYLIDSVLTHKHKIRVEKLTTDFFILSGLLWTIVNYGRKKFNNIGPRGLMLFQNYGR
jgi:hypothetical protein